MTLSLPTPNAGTRLNQLLPGQCAVVRHVESESEDIQRLKMLGVCVGRRVEIVKAGDPLIIRIFSSRIGISASLATRVWLEVCTPEHCALSAGS
ncbi:MAG: FeoA family protein [Verrucomicrobiota bacterium]|jgi:Fe2+ transport system protein FeoA